MSKLELNYLTVKDLYNALDECIKNGMGERMVLIPNWTDEIKDQDYVSVAEVFTDDCSKQCIYLEPNTVEDEIMISKLVFKN